MHAQTYSSSSSFVFESLTQAFVAESMDFNNPVESFHVLDSLRQSSALPFGTYSGSPAATLLTDPNTIYDPDLDCIFSDYNVIEFKGVELDGPLPAQSSRTSLLTSTPIYDESAVADIPISVATPSSISNGGKVSRHELYPLASALSHSQARKVYSDFADDEGSFDDNDSLSWDIKNEATACEISTTARAALQDCGADFQVSYNDNSDNRLAPGPPPRISKRRAEEEATEGNLTAMILSSTSPGLLGDVLKLSPPADKRATNETKKTRKTKTKPTPRVGKIMIPWNKVEDYLQTSDEYDYVCPICQISPTARKSLDFKRHIKSHGGPVVICKGVPQDQAHKYHLALSRSEPFLFRGEWRVGGCLGKFSRKDSLWRHCNQSSNGRDCVYEISV